MRWPYRRFRGCCPSEEAVFAMEQGKRARKDAKLLHERVSEVADWSAEIRRRNHLAAAVAQVFRGEV